MAVRRWTFGQQVHLKVSSLNMMAIGRWIERASSASKAIPRTAALSIVGPAALLVLGYLSWSIWGAKALDQTYFSLTYEKLRVTEQPVWIKTNVSKMVYEQSFLRDVSILDRNSTSTIARAFDLHPWVRRTTRVIKRDGHVLVDLEYRQPIALVGLDPSTPSARKRAEERKKAEATTRISGSAYSADSWDFLPVDSECVILPTEPPESYQVWDYMLVYARGADTSKHYGEAFGDIRIHDAVKLCTLLNPLRRELNLEGIYVYEVPLPTGKKDFRLEVADRKVEGKAPRRLTWGHAIGAEVTGEFDPNTKLQKLYQFFSSENKTLNSIDISGIQWPSPN